MFNAVRVSLEGKVGGAGVSAFAAIACGVAVRESKIGSDKFHLLSMEDLYHANGNPWLLQVDPEDNRVELYYKRLRGKQGCPT